MLIRTDREGREFIQVLVDLARKHVAFNEVPVLYNVLSRVEEIKDDKEELGSEEES